MMAAGHQRKAPHQMHGRGNTEGRVKDGEDCGVIGYDDIPYMGGEYYGKKFYHGDRHLVHRVRPHTSKPPAVPESTKTSQAGHVGSYEEVGRVEMEGPSNEKIPATMPSTDERRC